MLLVIDIKYNTHPHKFTTISPITFVKNWHWTTSKFGHIINHNIYKQKLEKDRNEENDVLSSCGEWNMEEEARKEANRVFEEVEQNVVMI